MRTSFLKEDGNRPGLARDFEYGVHFEATGQQQVIEFGWFCKRNAMVQFEKIEKRDPLHHVTSFVHRHSQR